MRYAELVERRGTISVHVNPRLAMHATASVRAPKSVVAAAPDCLRKSTVDVQVSGARLKTLIDTRGSLSFIDFSFVKEQRIRILPYFGRVMMANSSLSSEAIGLCKVEV
jgi:hypothetical protein